MATPTETVSAALAEADRLRKALKKNRGAQVRNRDDLDLVKATVQTWFNTHRKVFSRESPTLSSADEIYKSLLAASDRATSLAAYDKQLKALRGVLISLRDSVVGAPSASDISDSPPDFSPLANADMQAVLVGRWDECIRCVAASAPMAATVMMGGLLETLLLARINRENDKAPVFTARAAPRDRAGKTLAISDWGLKDFIGVCHELGWISVSASAVAAVLRDFRNYIHPHKQLSHAVHLNDDDAIVFWDVSKTITRQLLKNCPP